MEISINKKEEEEGEEMLYYVHDGLEKQICAFVWGVMGPWDERVGLIMKTRLRQRYEQGH